jgi:hypothetical protein
VNEAETAVAMSFAQQSVVARHLLDVAPQLASVEV